MFLTHLNDALRLCFATTVFVSCSFAVTPTIGVASGTDTFTLDGAKMEGIANVFEGSKIKTDTSPNRVYLQTGEALVLGTHSSGVFYNDRVLLQQGAARIRGMNHYRIDVGRYRIQSTETTSDA